MKEFLIKNPSTYMEPVFLALYFDYIAGSDAATPAVAYLWIVSSLYSVQTGQIFLILLNRCVIIQQFSFLSCRKPGFYSGIMNWYHVCD